MFTCHVCHHHRLHQISGKTELVAEKQRSHERQVLKLTERYCVVEKLPLGLQGEKLVDEFFGIGEKVVVVVLVSAISTDLYRKFAR